MPDVAKEFGEAGTNLYGWAFTAFFLGTLIGIVAAGGLVARGLAPPFLGGLGLFAIGLLIGGLAPSMQVLILARFIQGLGAGVVVTAATTTSGRSPRKTARQPIVSPTIPAIAGPRTPGNAQAVESHANIRGRMSSGMLRAIAT